MNDALLRNLTAEERLRYLEAGGEIPAVFRQLAERAAEAEAELAELETDHESIDEQLDFARDLVEGIVDCLDGHTRARDLKTAIRALVEESQLEL